jgi:hypothetical protein
MRIFPRIFCIPPLVLGFMLPLQAQRPFLFTENANTDCDGNLSLGIGAEYLEKDKSIPLEAPTRLLRIPTIHTHLGLGENVDVLVDWRGRLYAEQGTGKHVSDWGNLILGTKVNFLIEAKSQPSLGVIYLVKLPNTSHAQLLGSNETDFFLSLLAAKRLGILRLRLNAGVGILDDPDHLDSQLDIYTIGAAGIVRVSKKCNLFAEWTGFLSPHRSQEKFTTQEHRQALKRDFWFIYNAPTLEDARSRYRSFCHRWHAREPAAVESLRDDWLTTSTFFGLPNALRTVCRSTNMFEWIYHELRRRVKVIGAFPTPQSCERITFLTLMHIGEINLNKSGNMLSFFSKFTQN